MARSTYVYVVMGVASRAPVATFTVKYEMQAWIRDRLNPRLFRYFRHKDGYPRRWNGKTYDHLDPVELNPEDLIND